MNILIIMVFLWIGFIVGTFFYAQIVLSLIYSLPKSTWLFLHKKIRFQAILINIGVSFLWLIIYLAFGLFFSLVTGLLNFPTVFGKAYYIGSFISFVYLLFGFFRSKGRADMRDDYERSTYSKYKIIHQLNDVGVYKKVCVIKSDITQMEVDAIVNSAHHTLLAGSGVCGAIHQAAGKELDKECRKIVGENSLPGQVPLTKGYNLKAKYVLHVIVPHAKEHGKISASEEKALAKCYREAIYTANHCGIKTLAFPSLGTGIRGYPIKKVAPLVIKTLIEYLYEYVPEAFNKVYIVTYSDDDYQVYKQAFDKYFLENN